jgi:conjugative transfer signal peptidase TraF
MKATKTSIIYVTIAVGLLLVYGVFITLGGIIYTGTDVPPGLYLKVDKPIAIGRYAIVCPPNRPEFLNARERGYLNAGNCPDNFDSMMLKVAAKRKDNLTINDNGVLVNNVLLPQSQPFGKIKDDQGIPKLKLDHYELKHNELLLLSESRQESFDGRYFGPVDVEQVEGIISPVFQW